MYSFLSCVRGLFLKFLQKVKPVTSKRSFKFPRKRNFILMHGEDKNKFHSFDVIQTLTKFIETDYKADNLFSFDSYQMVSTSVLNDKILSLLKTHLNLTSNTQFHFIANAW